MTVHTTFPREPRDDRIKRILASVGWGRTSEERAVEQQAYPRICPSCRGTGGGVYNDCPTCGGNGEI